MIDNSSTPEPQNSVSAPTTKSGGVVWRAIAIVIAIIVFIPIGSLLCTAGGGFAVLRSFLDQLSPPSRASVTSTQTIVVRIQPLGQLVSVSTQLAKADIFVGVQQSTGNVCGFSANHVAQGAVEAGIDLTLMREEDATYNAETNTYSLTVPAPQLTSCRVDYIRQYDRSTTLCSVDWDEARLLANYNALSGFRDDALEGGILTVAEQQARLVLMSFIEGITGANVVINFRQDSNATLPTSCQPDEPLGWLYDESTNAWSRQN